MRNRVLVAAEEAPTGSNYHSSAIELSRGSNFKNSPFANLIGFRQTGLPLTKLKIL